MQLFPPIRSQVAFSYCRQLSYSAIRGLPVGMPAAVKPLPQLHRVLHPCCARRKRFSRDQPCGQRSRVEAQDKFAPPAPRQTRCRRAQAKWLQHAICLAWPAFQSSSQGSYCLLGHVSVNTQLTQLRHKREPDLPCPLSFPCILYRIIDFQVLIQLAPSVVLSQNYWVK
jgi:hypothetical protein